MTEAERPGGRETTRARILATALRLFGERGFEATTMRQIADACQVTERTVYRYFPFKDDLVLAEVRGLIPLLRDLTAGRPPGERPFTAVWRALRTLQETHPHVMGLLVRDMGERLLDKSGPGMQRMIEEFCEGLADGLRPRLAGASTPTVRLLGLPAGDAPQDAYGTRDARTAQDGSDWVFRSRVLASAAISPLLSALKTCVELPVAERTVDRVNALLDEAYTAMGDG
ncbi:TetR/AcrR family transcriptional regulator [Streptomyces sp. 8L]|uniref:TetR/AcrR family transcriptional regulator n=1 Tax=Streptomyces sp. 8L TaxID=2877242 RepID=UPI001CD6C9E1|nr:TetR/AcrR family transcriptional regulator [Streptomyces sp. 8L]MCA1219710.1 TetR/AcrR family transcriptional regulator [Streptomyces sp. 8L]